jgi:hypothetical protein
LRLEQALEKLHGVAVAIAEQHGSCSKFLPLDLRSAVEHYDSPSMTIDESHGVESATTETEIPLGECCVHGTLCPMTTVGALVGNTASSRQSEGNLKNWPRPSQPTNASTQRRVRVCLPRSPPVANAILLEYPTSKGQADHESNFPFGNSGSMFAVPDGMFAFLKPPQVPLRCDQKAQRENAIPQVSVQNSSTRPIIRSCTEEHSQQKSPFAFVLTHGTTMQPDTRVS